MPLEIYPIGGFGEIGRNMIVVKYKSDAVILDLGLNLDNYISLTRNKHDDEISLDELFSVNALPDINLFKKFVPYVRAIIPSHAHLDHVGAIPFLYSFFNKSVVLASPFTFEFLKELEDKKSNRFFKMKKLSLNAKYRISRNLTIHFIASSHSVPHTVFIVVETPQGNVIYANDFKIDYTPIVGNSPNLRKLAKFKGPKLLVIDTLYADRLSKTPSEMMARNMLRNILLSITSKNSAIFITTFSSHIARLKSIVDFSKKIRREPVFIGRSLIKYLKAAKRAKIVNFFRYKQIRYSRQLVRFLKRLQKERNKYLVICTGHQGEPNSILSRIVYNNLFNFSPHDYVIFSSNVIPNEENIRNREQLVEYLKNKNVNVIEDVHVSGHASRQDHKILLDLLLPKYVMPAHSLKQNQEVFKLFVSQNYNIKTIIAKNGDNFVF